MINYGGHKLILSKAYWILPSGEIIDIGLSTHISYIIQHPAKFNLSLDEIKSTYKKYDEPIPVEGIARKEIILDLLEQGFIRVRQYKTHWSISLKEWDKSQHLLSKWADIATNIKNAGQYMPVIITTLNGSKFNYIVQDLLSPTV